MPTLDLMDVTEDPPVRVDSVTLTDDGGLDYEGDAIKDIFATYVDRFPNEEIFDNFSGWSNGYLKLQPKAGD
jgi:hypothetical protein